MRTSNFFRTIAAALLIAVLTFALNTDVAARTLSLQKLAQEGTSFLQAEAGISAYTNVEQSITLDWLKEAYRTIEDEEDQYLLGSVAIPGYGGALGKC